MPTLTPNMQIVNMLANDVWDETAILSRVRSVTDSYVPQVRQQELQTIMLGQIAYDISNGTKGRAAAPDEQAEIDLVQQLTVQGAVNAAKARADMTLLRQVKHYECAQRRLSLPPIEGDEADALARAAAQVVVDTASVQVLELAVLRTPVVAMAMCSVMDESLELEQPSTDA